MKTHKASLKRFRVTGTGKIVRRCAGKQHLLSKKNAKRRKRLSKMDLDISQNLVLSGVDEVNLLSLSECRVADQILDLVPNIEVGSCFTLHFFKLYGRLPYLYWPEWCD